MGQGKESWQLIGSFCFEVVEGGERGFQGTQLLPALNLLELQRVLAPYGRGPIFKKFVQLK